MNSIDSGIAIVVNLQEAKPRVSITLSLEGSNGGDWKYVISKA